MRLVVQVTTRFAVEDFFSYKSFHAKKEKNWVLTSYLQEEYEIGRWVFLSFVSLKTRKQRIFLPTSYIQEQLKYGKPRKPLSPPGLVCHHKRGTWERKEKDQRRWSVATKGGREKEKKKTKEGGLSPQEGDVRKTRKEKKRKRPRKARRWLKRRQGSVCPTPRIPFFGSRVFGLRSGPSRLKYRLLQDLVYKEAMCKRSSGNGLLYKAKALP